MRHNRIEVYVVWFVMARMCPHTFSPDQYRDVYKECFTEREAQEEFGNWMISDVPVPDDYCYAYIEQTDRYDD